VSSLCNRLAAISERYEAALKSVEYFATRAVDAKRLDKLEQHGWADQDELWELVVNRVTKDARRHPTLRAAIDAMKGSE